MPVTVVDLIFGYVYEKVVFFWVVALEKIKMIIVAVTNVTVHIHYSII
jgi:hypothetical protein